MARKRKTREENIEPAEAQPRKEMKPNASDTTHPEPPTAAQQLVIRVRGSIMRAGAQTQFAHVKLKLPQRSRRQRNAKKENVMEWEWGCALCF